MIAFSKPYLNLCELYPRPPFLCRLGYGSQVYILCYAYYIKHLLCNLFPPLLHLDNGYHTVFIIFSGFLRVILEPWGVALAMIHLTRQHFMRDLREMRGFCHFPSLSFCPLGSPSRPLASGSRPPSTPFCPSAWRTKTMRKYIKRAQIFKAFEEGWCSKTPSF